ncbi:MAG TPA: hypothetical protein VFS40_01495 [Gemmatimonadales bacterium]|nr:hypothetical protein [Gemmatimonadales bacterium]
MRLSALLVPCALLLSTRGLAAQQSIRVPTGRPIPVLLDGWLAPGEWDDAAVVPVADSVRLLLKQVGGQVFVAVTSGAPVGRPIDLYLQDASGRITQLHASMQLGERVRGDTVWRDEVPAWHWGNRVDWTANEAKLDEHRPATGTFSSRLFPGDVTEFQIRRSRFGGREWRLWVEVGFFPGTAGGPYFYPREATRDPRTWAVLRLD